MAQSVRPNVLNLPDSIPDLATFGDVVGRALDKAIAEPEIRDKIGVGTEGNPITVQRVPTGAEAAEKLIRNANNAAGDWEKGIQRPKASFKTAALAAAGKHKANTLAALNEDRFSKGMAKVNEDEAIRTALAVGGAGFAAGINARKDKITRVMNEVMPLIAAVAETVDRMPQDTDQQREARMVGNLRGMREVGKKRRG